MAENTFVCTTDQLYSGPPQAVQQHGGELGIKTHGASNRNMVQSFLKRHLPANRLQAKEDNISFSVVPLVNPVRRKRFNHSRLKRKKLTNRERKETKPFKIPKDNQRLNSPGEMQAASQKILRAELQGSILTVQRSKCPSLVGVWGIVLQETRHTFVFLTPQDAVKCVPKVNSVFTMEWGGCVFTIHGNHFRVKAAERSSRKFKVKSTTDL
ncbi:ribonuclease P protein subunit p29-like isoform X2 [Babylonia areolata]|uniref:ribonuclease P protein subunit p29-like isoform X2 n=1 Tax=Babylonia areolata TaxID=304850 RepID=UPI003FD68569